MDAAFTTGGLTAPAPQPRPQSSPELGRAALVFVMNAHADSAPTTRETIRRCVEEAGRSAHFVEVKHPRELSKRAEQAAAMAQRLQGVLVAVGGDGTLNAVAEAALAAGLPLGMLPQGTFNYFCRNLGIPEQLEDALAVLLEPELREIRLGQISSPLNTQAQLFLVSVSLGFYPQLIQDRERWKHRLGRSRGVALGAGLWSLLGRHRTLYLSLQLVEGGGLHRIKTSTLIVSDNALQLAHLGLPEAEATAQGGLTALLIRASSRWRLLGLALRGALGRLAEDASLQRLSCQQLEVKVHRAPASYQFKVAVDGEIVRHASPLLVQLAPQPLRVLVPPASLLSDELQQAQQDMAERPGAS
jgi:diacylglycerol kinase family enzyme